MIRTISTFIIAGLLVSGTALADDIQKCADPDGGITYQDSPCPGGKTLATLPRAPAYADPAALRLAESQRLRLERAQESRARLALLDASRDAIARGAYPRLEVPAYDVAPPPSAEPYYYSVPAYPQKVRPQRIHDPRATPGSGTLAPPGILDSPVPCSTLQCQQQRAARAGGRPR